MISYKSKFIIITPQKTSSTTMVTALKNYIAGNINVTSDCFDYGDEFRTGTAKHTPLHIYYDKWNTVKSCNQLGCLPDEDKMGSIEDYFKAGLVRNPFDRLVSWWYKGNKGTPLLQWLQHHNQSLHLPGHIPFFTRGVNDGPVEVEYFIRFENLQDDFNVFCDKVDIPHETLPHKNKSDHKHYTEYYDDATRKFVEEMYAKDLEYFEYKFGD